MSALYFIPCRWQAEQYSPVVHGFAVCSDADTPITFLYPDGLPCISDLIWSYSLQHYSPWAKLEND